MVDAATPLPHRAAPWARRGERTDRGPQCVGGVVLSRQTLVTLAQKFVSGALGIAA